MRFCVSSELGSPKPVNTRAFGGSLLLSCTLLAYFHCTGKELARDVCHVSVVCMSCDQVHMLQLYTRTILYLLLCTDEVLSLLDRLPIATVGRQIPSTTCFLRDVLNLENTLKALSNLFGDKTMMPSMKAMVTITDPAYSNKLRNINSLSWFRRNFAKWEVKLKASILLYTAV